MKHTSSIGIVFFTISLEVSDTHISCIYTEIDDMMSQVLYVEDSKDVSKQFQISFS